MLLEAVSLITPLNPAGSPIACRSQSVASSSISVAAGDVRQSMPLTLRVAIRSSARIPGADELIPK